jgi:plasmid stabilization system protein ParE
MKSVAVELTAAARLDLLQLWNYVADSSGVGDADRVLSDMETALNFVAERPNCGHKRGDLTRRPLLFYRVHSFLIVYQAGRKPLRIIRILHAARDISSLLADN